MTTFSTRYVSPTTRPPAGPHERALVLGGGGALGNAWLIGVVAGLAEGGLDVTGADLVIGTSAGATAAAQLTGAPPTGLLAAALETPPQHRAGPAPSGGGRAAGQDHLERTDRLFAASTDPADMRRRMGAAAIGLATGAGEAGQARWRATVAPRLPAPDWPGRDVLLTAVEASTGEPVVFDRHSGVELVDAVAASCAGGPAYAVGGTWYIDGGYRRSSENADLAAGSARVLVLSPLGGRTRAPLGWGMQLAVQVDELRAGGSSVETVLPDGAALEAFGDSMVDVSRRPLAAAAGRDHGRALAGRLAGFWG